MGSGRHEVVGKLEKKRRAPAVPAQTSTMPSNLARPKVAARITPAHAATGATSTTVTRMSG
jgi:hypothetical protein